MSRRTALITGSGKNIGRATALYLARDGFNVVVNGSRDEAACEAVAEEAKAHGVEAIVAMGDVGKREDCERIVQAGEAAFGGIDVLVNNAAIRPMNPFLEMSEEEWNRVIDVDFTAAFRLSRLCLPHMIARGWGRIVNIAGMNAIQGYNGRSHVSVA
ncbi:MAG: SDR family NAD(P)-dependent oxidoreductase, partial [Alphaproteobacteria bacterium]